MKAITSDLESYNFKCSLTSAEQYCKGRNCCFFCNRKNNCRKKCKNDPTACGYAKEMKKIED